MVFNALGKWDFKAIMNGILQFLWVHYYFLNAKFISHHIISLFNRISSIAIFLLLKTMSRCYHVIEGLVEINKKWREIGNKRSGKTSQKYSKKTTPIMFILWVKSIELRFSQHQRKLSPTSHWADCFLSKNHWRKHFPKVNSQTELIRKKNVR